MASPHTVETYLHGELRAVVDQMVQHRGPEHTHRPSAEDHLTTLFDVHVRMKTSSLVEVVATAAS